MTADDLTIRRDQPYADNPSGGQLLADLYYPATQPRAGVVYLHGGGWRLGTRTDHEQARAVQLARRGYLVASITYRLTGEAVFPAQLDDALAAVSWLRSLLALENPNSVRVGAWGASAGGHLAALLALGNVTAGREPAVDAAAVWFAPLDFTAASGGSPLERQALPVSSAEGLLGGRFDPTISWHRDADPISQVSPQSSPMLLASGDRDRMVPDSVSVRMHDALTNVGVPSILMLFGGAGHEDPMLERETGIGAVASFFDQYLA